MSITFVQHQCGKILHESDELESISTAWRGKINKVVPINCLIWKILNEDR